MKKVVIAIVLMLAASASWAASTLISVSVSTVSTMLNVGKDGNGKNVALDPKSTPTIDLYVVEISRGNNAADASKMVGELNAAYSSGTLVLDTYNHNWGVKATAETAGAIHTMDANHNTVYYTQMGTLGKATYDTTKWGTTVQRIDNVDMGEYPSGQYSYFNLIYFTDQYQQGDNYVNAAISTGKYGYGSTSSPLAFTGTAAFGNNSSVLSTNGGFIYGGASQGWVLGGGYTVVVPEPTSGMMLLIGLAGLALKRKRI